MASSESERGFTLIELLVVIIIIGILSAIAVPTFLRQREKAYRTAAISDMKNAAIALESYASDNLGSYAGANGATGVSPIIRSEGFRQSQWVSLTVVADAANFCIQGENLHLPGKTFVYRSTGGALEIGITGLLTC